MRPLDGPDLFHLAQERPDRPMHTIKAAVLERPVDRSAIDEWAVTTLTACEPLRWRLERIGLALPVWVDADELDLGYHVRHHALAAPGDEASFSAALADLCTPMLDRHRPLWRLWHLTGLAGNRDALVFQIHHAVADGAASTALWQAIADGAPHEPSVATPGPTRSDLAWATARRGAGQLARLPGQFRRFGAYINHSRTVERSEAPSVTKAFVGPATRFNRTVESSRRCAFRALPLARMHHARRGLEASFNELFLTMCGRAVHRHLDELGEPPDVSLTATVPAALPRSQPFGNSVTTLYVSLRSDVADARTRLGAVRESLLATKRATERDERLLPDWQRYARLNHGLITVMEMTERRGGRPAYNLIASNVRGPEPIRLAGAEVVELRSIGPLAGHLGLNITGWSYRDDFMVGIHCYASVAAHIDRIGELMLEELDAVEQAGVTEGVKP
jgi:WS/DGAT/MGAT family acyltransferase